PESVSDLTEDALAFSGLVIIPGLVGGTLLADRIMRIYGPEFVVGEAVLPVLIAALLVYTYTKQLLNTLNAIDRPDLAFRANGAFIVSNVTLNVVLVWQLGWIGAAIATALSAAVGLGVAYVYLRALVPFAVPFVAIGEQVAAALIMGFVVYGGLWLENTYRIVGHNVAVVLLLVGAGAGVYFLSLFSISSRFRATVSNNLPFEIPSFGS
ncbi:MAG: polysaccharide biosynthesis C-terminal domain-containing protein, partial [Halalkalicoccus sp.]